MSYFQTTKSLRPKVEVLERKKVWDGGVVRINVPASAQPALYDDGKIQVPYLYFNHSVAGGRVHLHVLLQNADELRGKSITALATVYEKTIEGGRKFVYVDFTPVSDDTQVTHRFFVMSYADRLEMPKNEGWIRFDLPKPLDGLIAFGTPDAIMPDPTPLHRLTPEDLWIGGVPEAYATSGNSVREAPASEAKISDLASKFKVTKRK